MCSLNKVSKIVTPFLGSLRKYCISTVVKNRVKPCGKNVKALGQPTNFTHPHLLKEDEVTPMISKSEYHERRYKLATSIVQNAKQSCDIQKNHVIVIPGASKQYMSDKIPYFFRQNTEFLYLTGCKEPDCCLVITIDEAYTEPCSILFTRDKDSHAELWDGPRTHPEDALSFFGVDKGLPMSEFDGFLTSCGRSFRDFYLWYDFATPVQKNVHNSVCNFMTDLCHKKWENPKNFIHKLRLYKSPAEIALMQKACDITAYGFAETMTVSEPGIAESQLFAKVDYECRIRGADYLAYPPVVAGGNRANTIHYINNDQIVEDGELVLMDAGCEYHGYASDITRTWPINGKFTPQQREMYELVYCVQEELIELCCKYPSIDTLFESMCYLLGKRLQEMKLLGIQPSNAYLMKAAYQLCPHHVSHYLGMDIHDTPTVSRGMKVEPGMVFTIEPGVYISTENKTMPKEYHGIGIRIEDDILMTINGPVVLSRKCPKHIDEIERLASQNQC